MKVIAQNSELEFQRLPKHHPFQGKDPHVEHLLTYHFFMKDDVNDEVPNGTPKTLIPSYGVVNYDGVLNLGGRPQRDHATHLQGWIERPIARSLIYKCSYVNDKNCHMQMIQ